MTKQVTDKKDAESASAALIGSTAVDRQETDFLRGVQPINHKHNVLFEGQVEIKTADLKRWKPTIVPNPVLLDDDE